MSDDTTTGAIETSAADDSNPQGQAPTETVESLSEKLAQYKEIAKKQETRAKENAAAAKELEAIRESQKTESEKNADRLAKADAAIASIPSQVANALKEHLVGLHQIDSEDAELFLTAAEPELLLKQVARLVGQSDNKQKANHVPAEGRTPNPAKGSTGERFAEFAESFFTR